MSIGSRRRVEHLSIGYTHSLKCITDELADDQLDDHSALQWSTSMSITIQCFWTSSQVEDIDTHFVLYNGPIENIFNIIHTHVLMHYAFSRY